MKSALRLVRIVIILEKTIYRVMASEVLTKARQMRYILYTLFALIVADGLFSNFFINQGLGQEWNPFLENIVGSQQFLSIKACGAFLIIVIMWEIYKKRPAIAFTSSLCFLVLYTGIIYWNSFAFILTDAF